MVNAASLPALFLTATWSTPSQLAISGTSYYLASMNGSWVQSREPDAVRIAQAEFNAIAGATPATGQDTGRLLVGGALKEVAAQVMGDGYRWIFLADPE
jgi:hypothetical protein